MINEFKNLSENRKLWVETTKSNGFEEGIKNLLTELYPDNAHFIYELLQNAEDTGATEVKFILKSDELIFQHNGRDFNFKDIEGITSIGQGTKKDDINKIGKFGVGFKAVFAYTNTPLIYSNKFNFSISDLVIPVEIDKRNYDYPTTMIFPFNNKNKLSIKAYEEIEKGLNSIQDNTLLFLKNINTIKFEYKDILNEIKRDELDEIKIIITNKVKNEKTIWLRFKKFLPMSSNLFVSIAYKIEENIETKKEQLVPIDGEVSIYFPAEKETSKLKFHIHAPFSSPVARDSIKDIEENNELIDLISILFCESLEFIKVNGYLNLNFLKLLPIEDDNLSSFYKPILETIIEFFNNQDYILTSDGIYTSAQNCYKISNKKIELLIKSKDLTYILGNDKENYWLNTSFSFGSREEKFLSQLKINNLKIIEIFKLFNNFKIESFFQNKDNKYLKQFYEFMYDEKSSFDGRDKETLKKFIKLNNGKMNIEGKECYFETESKYFDKNYIVEVETFSNSKKAKDFLEFLGVKNINLEEEINLLLSKYSNYHYGEHSSISEDENLEHWNIFLECYKTTGDVKIFNGYEDEPLKLLFNSKKEFDHTNKILLSKPFIENKLHLINGIDDCFTLNDIYLKLENQDLFIELIQKLGIITNLQITKQYISWKHPDHEKLKEKGIESKHNINNDYDIKGLEKLLKEPNYEVSLWIWKTLISSDKIKQFAEYQRTKNSQKNSAPSSLIYNLKKLNWIPDKNRNFYQPADIEQNMLSEEFIYDNSKGWMTAIGIGENFKKKKEYIQNEKIVQEATGFNLEILQKAKDSGITEKDLEQLINNRRNNNEVKKLKDSLQENQGNGETLAFIQAKNNETIIINEEKHKENISNDNKNIKPEFKTKTYTNNKIQDKENLVKIEEFLYKEYEGHCQICGDTFAYNGKNCFELKSLNIRKNRDVNRKGNTLSLCHKHHAIFNRNLQKNIFIEKLDKDKNIDINTMKENFEFYDFVGLENIKEENDAFYRLNKEDEFIRDVYFLPIKLFNKMEYIKFTEAHILEFIVIWNEN